MLGVLEMPLFLSSTGTGAEYMGLNKMSPSKVVTTSNHICTFSIPIFTNNRMILSTLVYSYIAGQSSGRSER